MPRDVNRESERISKRAGLWGSRILNTSRFSWSKPRLDILEWGANNVCRYGYCMVVVISKAFPAIFMNDCLDQGFIFRFNAAFLICHADYAVFTFSAGGCIMAEDVL